MLLAHSIFSSSSLLSLSMDSIKVVDPKAQKAILAHLHLEAVDLTGKRAQVLQLVREGWSFRLVQSLPRKCGKEDLDEKEKWYVACPGYFLGDVRKGLEEAYISFVVEVFDDGPAKSLRCGKSCLQALLVLQYSRQALHELAIMRAGSQDGEVFSPDNSVSRNQVLKTPLVHADHRVTRVVLRFGRAAEDEGGAPLPPVSSCPFLR